MSHTVRNIVIALVVVGVVIGIVAVVVMRRAVRAIPGAVGEVDPVTGRAWQSVAQYDAEQAVRDA